MPKFSEYFRLNADQPQLDFVDVSTDHDTAVFVDPYAIEIRSDAWSNECAEAVRIFFNEILAALKAGDDGRATYLVGQLHEPSETFLGLSRGKPQGRGVGRFQASQLLDAIRGSEAFKSGRLEDLSELALYIEGISRDKTSDLTTNIIRKQLVEYTNDQCKLLNISCEDYSGPPIWDSTSGEWKSDVVSLPYVDKQPVILVPKVIVRRNLSLNSSEFYSKHILTFLQAEHVESHGSLTRLIRGKRSIAKTVKGATKKPTKKELKSYHPLSGNLIVDMVKDHPQLLEYYKKLAAERSELINISDDDESVSRVCMLLGRKLNEIPPGVKSADEYHNLVQGILTTLFYPHLSLPRKEWEITDGRRRIDLVYMNDAREGFFQQRLQATNTAAAMVIVECKNYSNDIANPELDQLLGRFDRNRGYFGMLLCRSIDNEKAVMEKCRDYARSGRAFILPITDVDLHRWLDHKAQLNDRAINLELLEKYRSLIS